MPRRVRLDDDDFARRIAAWFDANRRDLPWRREPRDPYRALVSEAMLQQTQVSRVIEKYEAFLERFPTVHDLAAADEDHVLAAWSGLGYYRRAKHLHAAAKRIVSDHGGAVPSTAAELQSLPGVGRYTAGAVASIVCGEAAPIVDGNVSRVLLRIEGRDWSAADREAVAWAWERAETLVEKAADRREAGRFNEGLMELGATVCLPQGPRCPQCPVAEMCEAHRQGRQEEIPRPKPRTKRKRIHHAAALVEDGRGRVLVEKRPERVLWAGMWQAPTLEREDRAPTGEELAKWLGLERLERVTAFEHLTTHREVQFEVWRVARLKGDRAGPSPQTGAQWRAGSTLGELALASPHRRILAMCESARGLDR